MNRSVKNKKKLISRTQSLVLIDQQKPRQKTTKDMCVQRKIFKQLDPEECVQHNQLNAHEIILEIGGALANEYFDGPKNDLVQLFNQKREMLRKRMNYRFQKDVALILSEVKAEYAKQLQELIDNTVAKFDEAIRVTKTEITIKCEEEINNQVIDTEKMMLTNIENFLKAREEYLKLEFGKFKEQNLADFTEYYQQLITSYCIKHENHLAKINQEFNEKYINMKTLIKNKHRKALNLAKIKLEKKLLSRKQNIVSTPLVFVNDGEKQKRMESIEKLKAEKLEKLNRTNNQLEFYKRKIRNVINNYAKLVYSTEEHGSNVDYLLDKNKMLHKYLSCPTKDELQQIIQDEELSQVELN